MLWKMNDQVYSFFDDVKDYTFSAVDSLKKIVVGGMTLFALSVAPLQGVANETYTFGYSTDKYELSPSAVTGKVLMWQNPEENANRLKDERKAISFNESLVSNGISEMNSDAIDEATCVFKKLDELPIVNPRFAQLDSQSNTLFVTFGLPEKIRIAATRYLDENDDCLYFSVKGDNRLLFSGALPIDVFVERSFEVLHSVGWNA